MMFTKKQQAQHCTQLADILVGTTGYDHAQWVSELGQELSAGNYCKTVACALGWAAVHKIGGMSLGIGEDDTMFPQLTTMLQPYGTSPELVADEVFGFGSYLSIFATRRPVGTDHHRADDKLLSIERLREQAKRLLQR